MPEHNETVPKVEGEIVYEEDHPVLYDVEGQVAYLTLNRVKYHNSQNAQMLYALDDAFFKATGDDDVKVIVLRANGKHFSAGHDIGTPGRDYNVGREDRRSMNYNHDNKPGAEKAYVREQEVYLEFCRRWRAVPKPTIAQVHKGCIAGGLMLAWVCDLIVASDDAFFQDPVVQMGFPGVEYFAHPFELNVRQAKEFLLLGERWSAERVLAAGMINKVVPRDELETAVKDWAEKIAKQPRLAMALTKQACNHIEDLQGKRSGMDMVYGYHHFAHANNTIVKGDYIAGFDAKKMAEIEQEERELVHKALNTPLTQALGCDYPVIQTAMGWVSTSELVTASVSAGAFGFLAAAVMTPEACEAEIKAIKAKTDRPFGVNIHAFQQGIDRIIDMCIDYDVTALSYGRGPSPKIVEKVKAAGLKCVPTIGAAKHASKAVDMGADILVCQGQEGGGHTGFTPTWLLLAQVIDQNLGVPVVACGGFKDGRGLAAALAFGADGIAMGTRFMMTSDSPTPDATKAKYLSSEVTKIPVSTKLDGLPQRMVMNGTLADLEKSSKLGMLVRALQNGLKYKSQTGMSMTQTIKTAWGMASKTDRTLGQTMMAGNAPMIIQKAMVEGKPDEGVLPSGQVAGLIDDLPSCAELMSQIIADAETRLKAVGA